MMNSTRRAKLAGWVVIAIVILAGAIAVMEALHPAIGH